MSKQNIPVFKRDDRATRIFNILHYYTRELSFINYSLQMNITNPPFSNKFALHRIEYIEQKILNILFTVKFFYKITKKMPNTDLSYTYKKYKRTWRE